MYICDNRYRPHVKLDYVKELLAYESIDKCKEDLVAFGLSVLSVSESELTSAASSTSLATMTDRLNLTKSSSSPQILILDCKSSNTQNL